MAVVLNMPMKKFFVNYNTADGFPRAVTLEAVGSTGAKDLFAEKYPDCTIVSLYQVK